jgi:hypothetical protein
MSIIPSTAITIDGTTAWTLFYGTIGEDGMRDYDALNRPCDTCNGRGFRPLKEGPTVGIMVIENGLSPLGGCPDCDCTGRHCFTLDVQEPCRCKADCGDINQLAAHVVEVLPIVEENEDAYHDPETISADMLGGFWHGNRQISLSDDAAAGKFAIRLEIHKAQT